MNSPFANETTRCRLAQQAWARLSTRERLRPVQHFRRLLVDHAETLTQTVARDIGRSADEVLATDILPAADACLFLERQARRLLAPKRVPRSQRPIWLFGCDDAIHRRPWGVVGVIGTWNYPIFLNAVQILQALTAGNGALWKPSEFSPLLAEGLAALFREAGFPDDLFITLPATREAGPALAEAAIDHLVFTGSETVGRKLAARLGERLIPSTLELSGCDAVIVAGDASLPLAARAVWWGVTLNQGQTCLATRRVFVHRSIMAAFSDELRRVATDLQPRPLVTLNQATHAERLIADALRQGGRSLFADAPPRMVDEPSRIAPTIIVDATPAMALCQEASFAPIAGLIAFDDREEVVRAQRQCPFGLGASIFSADAREATRWAERLDVGMVCVNDLIAPTAHPATPFGGRGASGWGVTQGADGLLAMTAPQTVSVRGGSFRPHYEQRPSTPALLRGILKWKHAARFVDRCRGFWRMLRAMV